MTFTNKTDYNIHGLASIPHSEFFAFNLRIKRSSELKLSKEYINTIVIYARLVSLARSLFPVFLCGGGKKGLDQFTGAIS